MAGVCSVGVAAAAEQCWIPSDRTKGGWRTGLKFMTMEMCAISTISTISTISILDIPPPFLSAYHEPHPLYYFYETEAFFFSQHYIGWKRRNYNKYENEIYSLIKGIKNPKGFWACVEDGFHEKAAQCRTLGLRLSQRSACERTD